MEKRKTALITGASGFIGRYFVEEAIANGFEVYITVRKSSKFDHLQHLGITSILVDFTSQETIRASFEKAPKVAFDVVIHNAGVTNVITETNFKKYNGLLTRDFIRALKALDLIKGVFVYISSLAASGPGDPDSMEPITEHLTPSPISAYGRSKLLAEKFVKESGVNYLILRPTAVFGRGTNDYKGVVKGIERGVAIFFITRKQILSFIHADDLAKICFACLAQNIMDEVFLVSDGNTYTIDDFNKTIAEASNSKIRVNMKVPRWVLRFAGYTQGLLRVKSPMNSVDKANELTAINWHCKSEKLYTSIGYTPRHELAEVIFNEHEV